MRKGGMGGMAYEGEQFPKSENQVIVLSIRGKPVGDQTLRCCGHCGGYRRGVEPAACSLF